MRSNQIPDGRYLADPSCPIRPLSSALHLVVGGHFEPRTSRGLSTHLLSPIGSDEWPAAPAANLDDVKINDRPAAQSDSANPPDRTWDVIHRYGRKDQFA